MGFTKFDADSISAQHVFRQRTKAIVTGAGQDWTDTEMLGGLIWRDTGSTPVTDRLAGARSVGPSLAAINSSTAVGATFDCLVYNSGNATLTIGGRARVELHGDTEVPPGWVARVVYQITDLTTDLEYAKAKVLLEGDALAGTEASDFSFSNTDTNLVALDVQEAVDEIVANSFRFQLNPSGTHDGLPSGWSVLIDANNYKITHTLGTTDFHADFIPIYAGARYAAMELRSSTQLWISCTDDDGVYQTTSTPILVYVLVYNSLIE